MLDDPYDDRSYPSASSITEMSYRTTDFNHNGDGEDHKGDEKEEDNDQKDDSMNVEVAKKKRKKRGKRKSGKAQASSSVRRPSLYSNSYQNKPTGFEENYAGANITPGKPNNAKNKRTSILIDKNIFHDPGMTGNSAALWATNPFGDDNRAPAVLTNGLLRKWTDQSDPLASESTDHDSPEDEVWIDAETSLHQLKSLLPKIGAQEHYRILNGRDSGNDKSLPSLQIISNIRKATQNFELKALPETVNFGYQSELPYIPFQTERMKASGP